MFKDNSLNYHQIALLPVKHQVFFNAYVKNNLNVGQALLKSTSIYGDVIHVDFHNAFHHITENAEHTPLEGSSCIVESKRHSSVSISSKGASEGGLLLVLYNNFYLKISEIAISKTIKWVPENSL